VLLEPLVELLVFGDEIRDPGRSELHGRRSAYLSKMISLAKVLLQDDSYLKVGQHRPARVAGSRARLIRDGPRDFHHGGRLGSLLALLRRRSRGRGLARLNRRLPGYAGRTLGLDGCSLTRGRRPAGRKHKHLLKYAKGVNQVKIAYSRLFTRRVTAMPGSARFFLGVPPRAEGISAAGAGRIPVSTTDDPSRAGPLPRSSHAEREGGRVCDTTGATSESGASRVAAGATTALDGLRLPGSPDDPAATTTRQGSPAGVISWMSLSEEGGSCPRAFGSSGSVSARPKRCGADDNLVSQGVFPFKQKKKMGTRRWYAGTYRQDLLPFLFRPLQEWSRDGRAAGRRTRVKEVVRPVAYDDLREV
jgi:hypothetical protein